MIPAGSLLTAAIAIAALEAPAHACLRTAAPAQAEEEAPACEPAAPAVLERLLAEHEAAARAKDARALTAALLAMRPHDNPELADPALDALKYKASSADKKAAKAELSELGLDGRDDLAARLFEREAEVRAAGARVLANLPPEVGVKALSRALVDKQNQKERPFAIAATIDALGRLGVRDVEDEVVDLYRDFEHEDVCRAAVLYFGRVKTTDLDLVLMLCEQLSAPEPAAVDSAANPPAGYWEQRWKIWMAIRRDVSWSLKQITGRVFAPAEGEHKGDAAAAREWIEENAREIGLR